MSDPEIEDLGIRTYRIGPSGTGGRSPVVVGAFVVLLVAVVGFAALGGRDGTPSPSDAAVAPGDPTPRPTGTRRPTPTPTEAPFLPTVPNDPLPGSPALVIGTRANQSDVNLHRWSAGQTELVDGGVISSVLQDSSANGYTSIDLSPRWNGPTGARSGVALRTTVDESGYNERTSVSVFGPGGTVWQGPEFPFYLTPLWSNDGSILTIGSAPVWTVLRFETDGSIREQTVRVADDPLPRPSADSSAEPYIELPPMPYPLGYSVDGRWVYAARWSDLQPSLRIQFRVDLAADPLVVEQLGRLPTGPADRLAPTSNRDAIDPLTGRTAEIDWRGNDGRLTVFRSDGQREREVETGSTNVGSVIWTAEGDLLISTQPPGQGGGGPVEILRVDPDGSGSEFLLGASRVDGAWITTAGAGYAAITFWAQSRMLLVMLRTSDGATGAIEIPSSLVNSEMVIFEFVDP